MNTALLLVARLCNYTTVISTSLKNIIDLAKKELPDTPITQGDLEALVDSGLLRRKGMSGYQLLSPCADRLTPSSDALYRMILVYLSARWDTPMDYESLRALLMRSLRITSQHLKREPIIGTPLWDGDEDPAFDAAYWDALERLECDSYLWRHERGWGLTESGDQHAFEVQGKNLTTWWIERHKEEIYKTAPAFINKRLLRGEQNRHDGMEIVNDYLTAIMGRDTFRNRILEGKKILVSNLRQFCFQHYLGCIRKASRDGHQRAMAPGYKTRREQKGNFIPLKSDHDVVITLDEDEGHVTGFDVVTYQTAEDHIITHDMMMKAQTKLDASHKGKKDLPEMLGWLVEGYTMREISDTFGKTGQARQNQTKVIRRTLQHLLRE